jgi:hypothetical protein
MSDIPNGNGIRVSTRELYDAIRSLENKVADAMRMQDQMLREIADHSKRLRSLELRFYGILAGLVGAVAVIVRASAS